MRKPPPDLEPAVRDPKQLAKTGWVLFFIMVIGGVVIIAAYSKWAKNQAKDDRPALFYKITPEKDLTFMRQDGEVVELLDLKGKTVLINFISREDRETPVRSEEVMKRIAEKYADRGDFQLVTLLIDHVPGDADQLKAVLQTEAEKREMQLPQWWLGSTETKTLHTFIANQLKTNIYPHKEDGQWVYDTSLVLLDQNRNIRRAVVHQQRGGQPYVATFDFDQAEGWDKKGIKTGTDLSNAEQLEALLVSTIDRVLAESTQAP